MTCLSAAAPILAKYGCVIVLEPARSTMKMCSQLFRNPVMTDMSAANMRRQKEKAQLNLPGWYLGWQNAEMMLQNLDCNMLGFSLFVPCFYVRLDKRKSGITKALLEGAVALAREYGATVIEGFPFA